MKPVSQRRIKYVHLLGAVALCLIALQGVIAFAFRMRSTTALTHDQVSQLLRHIRVELNHTGQTHLPEALAFAAEDQAPLVVNLWQQGVLFASWQTDFLSLDQGTSWVIEQVRRTVLEKHLTDFTLQVDVVTAFGTIAPYEPLFALSIAEGRHGIAGFTPQQQVVLVTPGRLIAQGVFGSYVPLPAIEKQLTFGMSQSSALAALGAQVQMLGHNPEAFEFVSLARIDTISVVEDADRNVRPLRQSTVDKPEINAAGLRASVQAGADYLLANLGRDGKFAYHYNPLDDSALSQAYSWPRHCGTAYSLAQVGRILGRSDYVAAAKSALAYYAARLSNGPDQSLCVKEKSSCHLGGAALCLLAFAEYRIAEGDPRFDQIAEKTALFVRHLQRPDGFFYHRWQPGVGIDKDLMRLYASQQAVTGLARFALAFNDSKAKAAAVKGMDYLAGPYWDFFAGDFLFGAEHWSCLAAEVAFDLSPKPVYARFCVDVARFFSRLTIQATESSLPENVGGLTFTPFITPYMGGTGTGAEAMVAAIALGQKTDIDVRDLKSSLETMAGFISRGQISRHDVFQMKNPRRAIGGIFDALSRPGVRIDTVQHCISALVKALPFYPAATPEALQKAAQNYSILPM